MKRLILTAVLTVAALGAQAGGHSHFHGSRISFYWGAPYYPLTWSSPGPAYCYYPSYAYSYPSVGYDIYSRPNYAVNGVLGGALIGGLIGNSVHHQGWEGAGIGAAAGLVLGGLAEAGARNYERSYYYSTPSVSYSYSSPSTTVQTVPTVITSSTIATPSRSQNSTTYRTPSSMSSANALFGR